MIKRLTLALTSLAMFCSTAGIARTHGATPPDITREQARARAQQLFATFDVNGDGIVTREEAKTVGRRLLLQHAATGRDTAPGIGGRTRKYLENAFAGMQWVTEQQFEDTFLAHFDQMDTDHDGILTSAERSAAIRK